MGPAELAKFGIDPVKDFDSKVKSLTTAFNALTPVQQTGTRAGRNLKKRLDILTDKDPHGPFSFFMKQELAFKVRYPGVIDKNIKISPGTSQVLKVWKRAKSFDLFILFFNFDSDCLVGRIDGTLKIKP